MLYKENMSTFSHMFDERKAAQICAFFASAEGGLDKLKLIKLIYFAERTFMAKYRRPMLFDDFFSLYNGPICSATLNGINGQRSGSVWKEWIGLEGNRVTTKKELSRDDLDEISDAEFRILNEISEQYRTMTASQIRNASHNICPEYQDVEQGNRASITYREVFRAMGYGEREAFAAEEDCISIANDIKSLGFH